MKKIVSIISTVLFASTLAQASSSFNFNGRLINDNNLGEEGQASFEVSIKVGSCVAYSEVHSLNLAGTSGYFSLPIGSGSSAQGNVSDIFSKSSIASCLNGEVNHLVSPTDKVLLTADVSVAGVHKITLSNQEIKAVPFAVSAEKLAGIPAAQYLQKLSGVTESRIQALVSFILDSSDNKLVYSKSEVDAKLSQSSGDTQTSLADYAKLDASNINASAYNTKLGLSLVATSGLYADLANKPVLGSLAAKSSIDYAGSDITNKPSLGSLAAKSSIDYSSSDITNKPVIPSGSLASKNSVNAGELTSSFGGSGVESCSANQTMYYSSVLDKLACQAIAGDLSVARIKSSKVIIGTTASGGSAHTSTSAVLSVDTTLGNTIRISSTCNVGTDATAPDIDLTGLEDGATYTIINSETATATRCTFSATGKTFKYAPANAVRTTASTTIYSFIVDGPTVYVSWSTGFN